MRAKCIVKGQNTLKKISIILLAMLMLVGCQNNQFAGEELTKEEAKQIIIAEHSKECCGEAEILSIDSTDETYVIEWQISSIYEFGTDSVNKKTGKLKTIQSSRGACEWK